MPRVARNAVEFEVDGVIYRATFHHQHGELEGLGGVKTIKHITTCLLSNSRGDAVWTGESRCHRADEYRWQYGIKESLKRALADGGVDVSTPLYGQFMRAFYAEMKVRPVRVPPAIIYLEGLGAVGD